MVSVVAEQFYDKTYNRIDWGARVSSYRNEIDCDDGAEENSAEMSALLSGLNASHTAVYTAADLDYWGLNSLFHFDDLISS